MDRATRLRSQPRVDRPREHDMDVAAAWIIGGMVSGYAYQASIFFTLEEMTRKARAAGFTRQSSAAGCSSARCSAGWVGSNHSLRTPYFFCATVQVALIALQLLLVWIRRREQAYYRSASSPRGRGILPEWIVLGPHCRIATKPSLTRRRHRMRQMTLPRIESVNFLICTGRPLAALRKSRRAIPSRPTLVRLSQCGVCRAGCCR